MLPVNIKESIARKIATVSPGFIIFKNGSYVNATVTPVANTTYTATYFTPFNDASWNFETMAPYLISVVGNFFGQPLGNQIVTGTLLINIIGIIWVRQEDAAVPLFLLWTMGSILFGMNLVPQEWVWFLVAVQFIVLGGIMYTLWRGRRNS